MRIAAARRRMLSSVDLGTRRGKNEKPGGKNGKKHYLCVTIQTPDMKPNNLNGRYSKYSSGTKSVRINLANFQYNHKDNPEQGDIYINRTAMENKLKSWLLGPSKSGAYLVAGYRGMGKSSLVNTVINKITRSYDNALYYYIYKAESIAAFMAAYIFTAEHLFCEKAYMFQVPLAIFIVAAVFLIWNRYKYRLFKANDWIRIRPKYRRLDRAKLKKLLELNDNSEKQFWRIKIKINLGHEIINERDVLCLIATQVRNSYERFLRSGCNRPVFMALIEAVNSAIASILAIFLYNIVAIEAGKTYSYFWQMADIAKKAAEQTSIIRPLFIKLLALLTLFYASYRIAKYILSLIPVIKGRPWECRQRLKHLSDRISATISETKEKSAAAQSWLQLSAFSKKDKVYPLATVREIEAELSQIINTINSKHCSSNRVQFLIILDELDKVEGSAVSQGASEQPQGLTPPDFSSAISGFSGNATNSDRRRTVLHLLANMKLFLSSANAKFIFISGRELYEAFLADLSDREFAISSIFNGVINVDSFLSPQHEQSAISSMTEQYISECILPAKYLEDKMMANLEKNRVLKREVPSIRWCFEYLTSLDEKQEQKEEIRYAVMMLQYFSVYLSHVSNGSPKKIALYFEKYVQRSKDSLSLAEWNDTIELGRRSPNNYVLVFSPTDQQKIGFIFYLAAPIMNIIMGNVSNYGDKLLVISSFIVDHLFKFHGRGFSWRNIEQAPELLDMNKTPELRDFIASILEYMQQIYLYPVMVGLFQFKFRKRISEEISYISRISDEAAAIFNFTLNESQAVKQHNIKLLNYYMGMNADNAYEQAIGRIHATLGDLYFQEEDYSRAAQEYRDAYAILDKSADKDMPSAIIAQIRCLLKLGLTCEYRKTYNTAYIIYCQLIDSMIRMREIREAELGLDIVDSWTDDWRTKQPMIVDFGVRKNDNDSRLIKTGIKQEQYDRYRTQILNGMWDDNYLEYAPGEPALSNDYNPAEYSLDFDKLVSGFSNNLSPQKSSYVAKLSIFEDVRLVYKGVLAKLFVLEKMTMCGITQSKIDMAEAEFKYLHRTINIREKFFLSADFFDQLGKILFYKNNIGILDGSSNDSQRELLTATLYWCNIDLYAYIDEFCFNKHKECKWDAVGVKRKINEALSQIKWRDIEIDRDYCGEKPGVELINSIRRHVEACGKDYKMVMVEYLEYISGRFERQNWISMRKIDDCSKHRAQMRAKGWNPPCYACKCYNRSLQILMSSMFIDNPLTESGPYGRDESKALFLLRYSFKKYLRYTRTNHVRMLAASIVNIGDALYSCAMERVISAEVLTFIEEMLKFSSDDEKEALFDHRLKRIKLSKLDKALLYYLATYRYYKIARQPADAAESLTRMLRLLNEYVTIVEFDRTSALTDREKASFRACGEVLRTEKLFNNIMARYQRLVGERYDYNSISELYDYKWNLHMNTAIEAVNLTRLQMTTEIKEVQWLISDTLIKTLGVMNCFANGCLEQREILTRYRREVCLIHEYFNPMRTIRSTFYNEITASYARFSVNKRVMLDIFGCDPFVEESNTHQFRKTIVFCFAQCIERYLTSPVDKERLDSLIFKVQNTVEAKLEMVEFLLEDSITCLTDIIYILTPHNHISAFTHSYTAEIYTQMWQFTKMYEMLVQFYTYHYYPDKMRKIFAGYAPETKALIAKIADLIHDTAAGEKPDYGKRHHRLFARLRHKIDDRTLHHIFSNYAVEMALTNYSDAESAHNEGSVYKQQTDKNYLLNDDLDNDTLLFNTAIERFRLHTSYIANNKNRLLEQYKSTRFYPDSYLSSLDLEQANAIFDDIRFDDSLFTNSEA